MKPHLLLCACVCSAPGPGRTSADEPEPSLLGAPRPAADVVPTPETLIPHAISGDGRWVLFSAASDRWLTNDSNGALDSFLLDRATGQRTAITVGPSGGTGHGSSYATGMSETAERVAFVSRASDLFAGDDNQTWDVGVRDLNAGTNFLVSLALDGTVSPEPALAPWLTADGRYVVFRSAAKDLAPNRLFTVENLYRHDLLERKTVCLTAPPSGVLSQGLRLMDYAVTPAGNALVLVASAVSTALNSNVVACLDIASGAWSNCTRRLPAEIFGGTATAPEIRVPALSATGRRVTFRSEVSVGGNSRKYALCYHDLDSGTTVALTLRTNDRTRQIFPSDALKAALSAAGRFVAYAAPFPFDPSLPDSASRTNGPSQIYLWDGQTGTTRLISAAPDGITPANRHAQSPRISSDGRFVAFVSDATNLLPSATSPVPRAYWWDAQDGTLRLAGEVRDGPAGTPRGDAITGFAGSWFGVLATTPDGDPAILAVNAGAGAVEATPVPPLRTESVSGPGWLGVHAAGVSGDGRFVALTALPARSLGKTNHMQVYVHDTVSGVRDLRSRGVDDQLAQGHPGLPSLAADASRLLYVSAATNLVSDDPNALPDVFVETVATGERRLIRTSAVPAHAPALPDSVISPDGSYALVRFTEQNKAVSRLAHLEAGSLSAAFPGIILGMPSFARGGQRIAISISTIASGVDARIEVHDAHAWLASPTTVPPLWSSTLPAREPVLSADGSRVAYFHLPAHGTNAVVVADWEANRTVFSQRFDRRMPSGLSLSADGRYVAWAAPGSGTNAANQIWRADVNTGTILLVSESSDGSRDGNSHSKYAALSADGRYVAFASLADNLVPGDANRAKDVFLRDMDSGVTLLLSRSADGTPGDGWSLRPFFCADGHSLFFLSHAAKLVPGDLNEAVDLYKVEVLQADSQLLLVIERNLATGQGRLRWNSEPGKTYGIEFKEDLDALAWQRLPGEFTGEALVTVDPTNGPRTFFRVFELP